MITDLNQILIEWSYRTSDGQPDVKNRAKLILLENVLSDFGWSREARAELLSTLMVEDWWSDYTPAQQAQYIKDHPGSQKAQDAKEKEKEDDDDEEKPKAKDDEEPEDEERSLSPLPERYIKSRMAAVNNVLSKVSENPPHMTDEIKQTISSAVEKMMKGDDLTSEELKVAQSHLKFIRTAGVKDSPQPYGRVDIYLALNKPKTWYPSHQKVSLFADKGKNYVKQKDHEIWADSLTSKYDVYMGNTSEGAVGKKQLVPNKLSYERKVAKIEKQKDGSIVFNGKPMKKLKQPEPEVLVSAIRKNNPDMSEDEIKDRATVVIRQFERYNDQIDDLSEAGDFEYVDYGPVQSSDDRRKTSQSIISTTEDKFKDLLTKAGVMDKPENKKVFETLGKLKEDRDPENNENDREEYNEHLNQLLVDMANSVDFKDAVADFAEIKVALEKLSQGNPVYAPASETFKISDILIINPIDTSELDFNDADKLSENLKYLNVALEFVGGESVKYKGGGAGMSDDKVKQTVYKGKETRKRLNSLLEGYFTLYSDDRDPPNYPASLEKLKDRKQKLDDTVKWAINDGVISEEDAGLIDSYAERRADTLYEKFLKKGAGNCMDEKEKGRYKASISQYLKEMKMMEVINNNDLKYTKFGNSNQKISLKGGKPGKAYSEEIDGIKKPCYMKFKDDPGFSFSKTPGGCVTATPTNRNPSEIHAEKPKIKS